MKSDSSENLLSLNYIDPKVNFDEASKFIINCAASVTQKMKLAFIWSQTAADRDANCLGLQLIRFLENEYISNEDYVTGKKEFEIDGWLLENWDIEEIDIDAQLREYSYLIA